MRSGTVENLHDFKGKLDKIKELKIFKKIYAVTLDKCANRGKCGFILTNNRETVITVHKGLRQVIVQTCNLNK